MQDQDVLKVLTEEEKEMVLDFARNDMKVRQTARHYFMSHNGFRYHLTKIHGKTGLNPARFIDLMRLVSLISEERSSND